MQRSMKVIPRLFFSSNATPALDDLCQQLRPERCQKMQRVSGLRTEHIRLVIQDIFHPHNVSACLRSAEAFGIHNVHIVNQTGELNKPNHTGKGVDRWLNIHNHMDVDSVVSELHRKNYRIAAAMPSPTNCVSLEELPLDKPIAVIFGNEHEGISDTFAPHIDYYFTIPMVGMVESLNVSVCAAITMQHLAQRAKKLIGDASFYLSETEKHSLVNTWVSDHSRKTKYVRHRYQMSKLERQNRRASNVFGQDSN